MTIETIVGISRQTVELVLALAGPVLLAGLVVGLAVALFQAATQINRRMTDAEHWRGAKRMRDAHAAGGP
jgi:flagellar biosynthesis protein FliQ